MVPFSVLSHEVSFHMNKLCRISSVLLTVLGAAACSSSNPAQPSTFTTPVPVLPADRARFRNLDQPILLSVQNAVVTQTGTTTYTFEVATDSAFAAKVQTKDNVAEGSGGQTSVKLDALPADKDYYWHARAQRSGAVGPFGTTNTFNIGPAIVLSPPVAVSPLTGTQSASRPTFTVSNIVKLGQPGPLVYTFEIASNSGFSPVAVSGTVSEGAGQTSFTPTSDLGPGVTYYWRATAIDATNSLSSPPSTTQVFTTRPRTRQEDLAAQLGVPLWPGVQPPGSTGQAVMGDNWNVQTLYHAPSRTTFVSPTIEELRLFDLMDRGLDPQAAINWLPANGYPTTAAYYPSIRVIGVPYEYMALSASGRWDLVLRGE
jgi:hypothetical protein